MAIPKWAIKLFYGLFDCITLVLDYSVYKFSRISKIEQEAYRKGEEKAFAHFRAFFKASPEASGLYQEWREHQSKK